MKTYAFFILLIILAWGTLVWPTPYSYHSLTYQWGNSSQGVWTVTKLYRVHRLSGRAEIIANSPSASPEQKETP